jgi:hypothetical protein
MQIFYTSNRSTCGKTFNSRIVAQGLILDEFMFRLIILHAFFPHDVMSVTEHNTAFSELIAPRSLLGGSRNPGCSSRSLLMAVTQAIGTAHSWWP